jgi:hypothetical protein
LHLINYSHFAIYGSHLIKFSRKEGSFSSTLNLTENLPKLEVYAKSMQRSIFLSQSHTVCSPHLAPPPMRQQYVNIFSVFTLSHNVFIVLLMNIFYHFTFYFPLCFLLSSLLSTFLFAFYFFLFCFFLFLFFPFLQFLQFSCPFFKLFPPKGLNFGICFVKRGS